MEMAYYHPYQNTWNNPLTYQPQPQQQTQGLIWVDGEAAAKAYQMPAGWPANTPIALWDTNATTIYLKSTNQMGMPNPLQIAHYELEERKGMSGMGEERGKAWDEEMKALYASKEELIQLREEVEKLKKEEEKK
jgi:hypothetical protein